MIIKSRSDWMVWIAAAGAVVSVGVAANGVVQRLSDRDGGAVVAAGGQNVTLEPPPPAIEDILTLMPFGRTAPPPTSGLLSDSDLRLRLLGVVRAFPLTRSSAIISSENKPPRSYAVGDEIADGVRLDEIQNDHVVLEIDGRNEILSFAKGARPALRSSDSVAGDAEVLGDIDALRKLIFDQANGGSGVSGAN